MKKIQIIGVPIKEGCSAEGADLSYKYLKDSIDNLIAPDLETEIDVNFSCNKKIICNNMKNISRVMEINKRLYNSVFTSLNENYFPLIIGGDHSLAIGSISAVLDYYKGDVSVIYVDKHTDIHTEKTSPSGNIHGIPLSACIGRTNEFFLISKYKLNPMNLYFLGICNYEKEEMEYVNQEKIFNLKDYEINDNNIDIIIEELKKRIKTNYIHLSFDLDSICDKDFHAVNVSVHNTYQDNKGLSFETIKKLLDALLKNFKFCSMDFVEYNPLLDIDGKCKKKAELLFNIIKKNVH